MPRLSDEVFDQGLDYATTNGTRIDINYTQEPINYTEAITTYSCGTKTGLTTGSTVAGATDGRRVIVPAITDGSVDDTQLAGWWSLTDGTSLFVAAGALSGTQNVTSGNTFTLDAISLTIRDAA